MKGKRPGVCVVGSFVLDLVFKVDHRPGPGETMLARDFGMFLGGKGFNQAIAARRLGADVSMVGRLGGDTFGDMFMAKLEQEGIDSSRVTRDPEAGTAIASPVIDAGGENSIIAAPRANMRVTPEDAEAAEEQIAAADVLMLQFEIPPAASRRAAEIARKHDTLVLLDPAPVSHGGPVEVRSQSTEAGAQSSDTPDHWTTRPLDHFSIDYLVPNEIEAHMLTGKMTPEEAAAVLLPETRHGVVISLGEQGAMAVDRAALFRFPAYKVKTVDTTGAGDAFRAGLAVMLAQDKSLDDAVRFANACGALACTVMGAEPSMPRRQVVEMFLKEGDKP
ncbi:MAG: ribokinase [candidate division WOR-3 bacterium]|nr:ribokinase [candidate division WOR-3 bacterium]